MKYKFLLFTLALFTISFVSAQSIGIVGDAADGWPDPNGDPTPDIMLTDNGDGTYSIDALQLSDGEAKFRSNQVWAQNPSDTPDYGGTGFPTGTIDGNLGSPNIQVTAGTYDITLDLNNDTYEFLSVAPVSPPAAPTEDESNVVSIYSDEYTDLANINYDPDWGQSGFTQVNTTFDPSGNGSNFILAYPNFNYQGTDFGSNEDLSNMDFLHVDIWVPSGTDRMVKVSPINNGTGPGEVLVEVPVTPGSWNSVALPKSDFTDGAGTEMTWDSVFQLKFDGQFNADGTANTTPFDIYLDNIYFSETPTSTSTDYTFNLSDSFGDGWNGNEMEVLENGTVVETLGPQLDAGDGSNASVTVTLDVGANIELNWATAGNFPGEVGVNIISANGSTLFDMDSGNGGLAGESLYRSNVTDDDCAPSYNTTTNNIGPTSADINWLASVDEDGGYEWAVVPSGMTISDAVDSGTVAAGVLTASTSNLSASTDYDVYISSICGGGTGIANNFHSFTTLANCLPPNNFTVDNTTTNTVDLSWDDFGNAANGYEVLVFNEGDDPDTANPEGTETIASGITTATVSGLDENTAYEVYIKSVCSGTDESDLSSALAFSTSCLAKTAPYDENFDGDANNPIPDNGGLPNCWFGLVNDASGTATLEIDDGGNAGAPDPFSAPNHVELTTDDTDDSVALISPEFSDLGDQDKRIRFYAQRDDHAGDLLIGTMTDPSDITTFTLFETITNSQLEDGTWNEFTVGFDTYTGGSAHIVFLQEEPNAFSDTYVDNFVYEEIPSCIKPENLAASNASTDSVDLTWDEESPSTATDGYEWVVMASGDDPDTANPEESGTEANGTFTATVTGLSSNTEYDAYVRSVCDAASDEVSAWSGLASFTTLCSSFTTSYSENFDGVTSPTIPNCWSTVGNQASEVTTEESQFGLDDPPSGSNFVLFEDGFDLDDGDEAILVSPQFSDLPDADNRIRFKAAFEDGDAEDHKLFVGVMSDPTDATTFVEVGVVTSSTDGSFVEYTVDLSDQALIGSSEYIAIAGGSVADFDEIALDDFVYEEIPSCFKPENLTASNPSTDSIDLTWDEESPSTATDGYEWVIMASGDAPDPANAIETGTEANGTFTATVTGLSENMDYDAYVRSVCDAASDEVSAWSDIASFTTLCTPFTAPYDENFDGDANNPIPDNGGLPDCWSGLINDASGTATLEVDDGGNSGAPTPFSAPNHVEITTDDTDDSVALISPEFSDLGDQDKQIRFYAQRDDHAGDLLIGTMTDPSDISTFTLFETITNSQLEDGTWNEFTVGFDTYTGGSAHIVFLQEEPNAFSDTYVDNFVYEEIPSCIKPENLAASNASTDSIDLTWDEESPSTATDGYEWVVMASGDAPDTANAVETGTEANGTFTATVTGLSANMDYDAYVRSVCDAASDLVSDWSDMASFSTLCLTFDTFPFVEDFEDDSSSLSCWSQIQEVGAGDWTFDEGSSGGNISTANSGTQNARFVSQNADFDPITKLVSPVFDLTSLNNPELSFFYGQEVWFSDQNELKVYYRVDDQSAWVEIAHFTDDVNDWTEESLILPNPSATYQIAFEGINNWGRANVIDDVTIDEGPSCLKPLNLTASNVTDSSVDLTWDEESPSTATDGYEWVVMASGDAPDTANAVETGSVGNGVFTASVSNLTAETDYDAYVRSVCDAASSDVSEWTNAESFTTGITPTIVSVGNPASDTYCYDNNEFEEWRFDSDDGSPLTIIFSAGSVEPSSTGTFDDLIIYDGTDDTGAVLFDSDVDGNELEGLSFTAQSGSMYVTLDSDGSVNCQSEPDIDTIEFDVYIQGDEPPASVQIIHNSADPAAQTVDVYLNGTLAVDDLEFRTATTFVDVPSATPVDIDVAPGTSSDVSESLYNLNTTLTPGETYVAVANGVIDPSQFDDSVNTIDFGIDVFAGAQQSSTNAGEVSVLVNHGSTDAPTVDVVNDADQSILVDDISYTEFDGYLDLPTQDYTINVEAADNSAVVQSYEAPLQTLGLSDAAVTVVASGFLDPAANQSGEAFGLWVALPAGGDLVPLPEAQDETAEVQLIHNSADPAAEFVDIYLDGTLVADDFEFRTASDFIEVPAEQAIDIDVAPQGSSDVSESIFNLNTTLTADETYVAVANGVLDPSQFDSSVNTIAFGIDVFTGAQQSSTNAGETSVLVHHGSTDAPMVDVVNNDDQSILVDDISYTEFDGYLDLPTQDYTINVEAADNSAIVESYEANLQTLGLADAAITVVASGFLDPAANQNGEAFGLWVALPAGGPLVELPLATIGTDEFADNNFNYYPNPVEQRLNLNTNGLVEDIKVFNMLGQKVLEVQPEQESPQINMSGLQSGAYMMRVTIDGASRTFRLIKK